MTNKPARTGAGAPRPDEISLWKRCFLFLSGRGSGRNSGNQDGQSPLRARSRDERPLLVVSADQPRVVREIPRNP